MRYLLLYSLIIMLYNSSEMEAQAGTCPRHPWSPATDGEDECPLCSTRGKIPTAYDWYRPYLKPIPVLTEPTTPNYNFTHPYEYNPYDPTNPTFRPYRYNNQPTYTTQVR